jgi:hypothetical protein
MSNGGASSSPALNPRTSNAKSTRNQPKFQEGNKKFNDSSFSILLLVIHNFPFNLYQKGEKVFCYHGAFIYEAKVGLKISLT